MREEYITYSDNDFEILYPIRIEKFVFEAIEFAKKKKIEYLQFFQKNQFMKIKGAYFLKREDFVNHILKINPEANVPTWAKGCFYGQEIQTLISIEHPYTNFYTLSHEMFHLMFNEFIYHNEYRIRWLDESLACNFDGRIENKGMEAFQKLVQKTRENKKLPVMNDLELVEKVKTNDYDGYDLFAVVGKYLIDTRKDLLSFIKDKETVLKEGTHILKDSLEYFQ